MRKLLTTLLTTLLCFAGFLILSQPANAQFGQPDTGYSLGGSEEKSTSSVITSVNSIKPGETFQIALKLNHPKGWHSYYNNDGIGVSQIPAIKWTLPTGFKAAPLTFPTPHSMDSFGLNSYGYDGTNYFITNITAPKDLKIGQSLQITADASWQMCKISCIQESGKHTIKLTSSETTTPNPEYNKEIADYQKKYIPAQSPPTNWKISAQATPDTIEIEIDSRVCKKLHAWWL